MENMTRPKLGDLIIASAVVIKKRKGSHSTFDTTWEREEKEIRGIYTGYRTVYEGHSDILSWEESVSYGFVSHKHKEVWLIVDNPRQNPKHVLPEDCKRAEFVEWVSLYHINEDCTTCEELENES